jgi:D-alanyl-lipoteichoic acid acyltransferase DltB (MBOAT superfamily)
MFKKMVIADNIAAAVDLAWSDIPGMSGMNLLIAALLYPVQAYTDLSGYSDMAIGVAKILGLRVTKNFKYPFFGRNIAELWRNYHISLTSWMTDYVFMPLHIAFRNMGNLGMIAAIIINMLLVGLWHEANLTWAVFGFYNGVLYIPLILSGAFTKKKKLVTNKYGLPLLKDFVGMAGTFVLFAVGTLFVRAGSLEQAGEFMRQMVNNFLPVSFASIMAIQGKKAVLGPIALLVFEWYKRKNEYALQCFRYPIMEKLSVYGTIVLILLFGNFGENPFIYFQF